MTPPASGRSTSSAGTTSGRPTRPTGIQVIPVSRAANLAPLAIALGAGLLAGAGQLGIADGLGILRWHRSFPTDAPWREQLTWVAFIGVAAVVAGAVAGAWQARRRGLRVGLGLRIAVTLAGALGAAVIIPLVARQAGAATLTSTGDPRLTAGITAAVALVPGILAALAVLMLPAVSGNVVVWVLWLWLSAMMSVVWTLADGASWGTARLGLLPVDGGWIPALLLGAAALIGLVVSGVARFGGVRPAAVAASGVAGPLLVAIAYVIAGPGDGTQLTAYRYALMGIGLGLVVSVLVAVARRPTRRPDRTASPTDPSPAQHAGDGSGPADTSLPGLGTADTSRDRADPVDTEPIRPGDAGAEAAPDKPASIERSPSEDTPVQDDGIADDGIAEVSPTPGKVTEAGSALNITSPKLATSADVASSPGADAVSSADADNSTDVTGSTSAPGTDTTDAGAAAPKAAPVRRPAKRTGRRKAAEPAKLTEPDADYVDWVKGLGAEEPTARASGAPARHTKP